MRSHGKGSLSAAMRKREGVEPRNNLFCTGSRFLSPGNQYQCIRYGKNVSGVPGSKSVAGRRTVYTGTPENRNIPDENFRRAEEVIRKYSVSVAECVNIVEELIK